MMLNLPRDTEIRTARLFLRAPEKRDYLAWSEGRRQSREHLERWEPKWPADALSREDWARRLRVWKTAWREDRAYVFLVWDNSNDTLLGGASITNVRRGPAQAASLGYWLLGHATGQGFMREAVDALCRWCFDTLMLERIEAGTLPENLKSQRVLEACGFIEEGIAISYLEINGQRRDHVLFARLNTPKRQDA